MVGHQAHWRGCRAPRFESKGAQRRILSERYFTDHFGKLRESAKIVVLLWPQAARLTEKS